MRTILGFGALVVVLVGSPSLAQSSPVIGTWTVAAETPQGRLETTMTFAETGGVYSVTLPPPEVPGFEPQEAISDVVVDGSSFAFTRTLTTQQGPIAIRYTGAVDGDTLTGEASSPGGSIQLTGTRS